MWERVRWYIAVGWVLAVPVYVAYTAWPESGIFLGLIVVMLLFGLITYWSFSVLLKG
jgi:hypothetical protein